MGAEVHIEPMATRHLDQVVAIEKRCFSAPWSERTFVSEVTANPHANYFVAMADSQVVGYAGSWVVVDEVHITNIAVDPAWRRQGIARRLLEALLDCGRSQGARRATLEVRRSNSSAQALYAALGFVSVGIRPGYYTDNNEDAIIMWREDLKGKEDGNG